MKVWDWKIRSYQGEKFMVETVHRGDVSRDDELRAIRTCGRTCTVAALSVEAQRAWENGWRPPADIWKERR